MPGEVLLRAARPSGVFHLGRYPRASGADDEAELLARIWADWTGAGFTAVPRDDVMRWKYRKLVDNVGNCVQAMLGPQRGPGADRGRGQGGGARGAPTRRRCRDRRRRRGRRPGRGFRVRPPYRASPHELGGSSWQSLARGTGNIESDYLNGEIALIARRHGFDAPVNATLAALARAAAAAGRRPGDVSPETVRAALARSLPSVHEAGRR